MVPVRGVLEKMGAVVEWNQSTQSVSVKLGTNNVTLYVGSNTAMVNGVNKTMQYAAEITNDRTYIPLRFVSENLGAEVNWDESTYTVFIKSSQNTSVLFENTLDIMAQADSARESGNLEAAIKLYKKAIAADPAMTDAYTRLGNLFYEQQDFVTAAFYLESARKLNPGDTGIISTLGWAYYCDYKYDDSIRTFEELLNINPASAEANYGLGLCYASWSVKDYTNARIYLQKAINLDPNGSTGQNARNILTSLP
jgi:tetratricopeptide (TPR) repeat protein